MAIPMMLRRLRLVGSFSVLGLVILLVASPGARASGAGPSFICNADIVNTNGQFFGPVANPSPTCATQTPPTQQTLNQKFTESFGTVTVNASTLTVSTTLEAEAGKALADASLENLTLTIVVNNNTAIITADKLTADAQATCNNGEPLATSTGVPKNLVVKVNGSTVMANPPSTFKLAGVGTLIIGFARGGGSPTSDNTSGTVLAFFTIANTLMVAPDFSIPDVGAGVSNCTPGVPPTGGGPIPPAGEQPSWLLWGALLAALGLVGLSGTLAARKGGLPWRRKTITELRGDERG